MIIFESNCETKRVKLYHEDDLDLGPFPDLADL